MASVVRKQSAAWPAHLVEIPESKWPSRPEAQRPRAVWRSRHYLVQSWPAPALNGVEVLRLTVNRTTIRGDGHWEQDIPWDDLQRCKRETGYGDWYAVEIYPRDRDIVADCNMRHLWLLAEPLQLGWFDRRRP